jgi:hexosaminidase
MPAVVELEPTDTFHLNDRTRIVVDPHNEEVARIGAFLAGLIGNSVETTPQVIEVDGDAPPGSIVLTLQGDVRDLGPEGYSLAITSSGATVMAAEAAGLFYGVQTLRHLLPASVEYTAAYPRPLYLPTGHVLDRPRFAWRGAMLDVARHFFRPDDVKRYIDLMALYKLNRLHLHLSDDQGWRIEIPGWPNLTSVGGSTQVGGGPGGFYTREEYADLVRYASDRFITIVPEIDVPGHTNAALASYPALNCDGVAPPLFTGTAVGFSSLCVEKEETYAFLDDVVREIAALTPGPYFHIGGDEVRELTEEQYARFMARAQQIVAAHGKRVVGWDEIAETSLIPGTLVQVWRPQGSDSTSPALLSAVAGGATLILSPADRVYLDMKYDSTTDLGLSWAGYNDVRDAYDWEPTDLLPGVPDEAIAGVEAPLWSETLGTLADVEFMALPRLAGVAEVAWSTEASRDWSAYRLRLGAQVPRWTALGVNFFRSPLVPWSPPHGTATGHPPGP